MASLYNNEFGCYQSEWVAPREYIWYDGTGGTLHKIE